MFHIGSAYDVEDISYDVEDKLHLVVFSFAELWTGSTLVCRRKCKCRTNRSGVLGSIIAQERQLRESKRVRMS